MKKGEIANEFTVVHGEEVTIKAHPIRVGRFAIASKPAVETTKKGARKQTFVFTAEGEPGVVEGIVMRFDFPSATPKSGRTGRYELSVSSDSGDEFSAGTVRQRSNAKASTRKMKAIMFVLTEEEEE